jgi:hypothetical protein
MLKWVRVVLVCLPVVSASGQSASSQYQPGTITAVTTHESTGQKNSDPTQYDVSVKVGDTTYVVLFSPPNGSNIVKYSQGDELLVLVGNKTLTFNRTLSGKTEVPILSQATLAAHGPDWQKDSGQYFSMKLKHLTDTLALTEDQQATIKPILEQEAGEVDEIRFNPALSQKDMLNQYEKIVQASDKKIKRLLSATQLHKLEDLRKEQKQDLKRLIAQEKSSKP